MKLLGVGVRLLGSSLLPERITLPIYARAPRDPQPRLARVNIETLANKEHTPHGSFTMCWPSMPRPIVSRLRLGQPSAVYASAMTCDWDMLVHNRVVMHAHIALHLYSKLAF